MKKSRLACTAFVCLLITACSGEGESSSAAVNKGSSQPTPVDDAPAVDNEDLTPGLKGIDANANGIRDDIDRFIARHYSATPMIKKVAEKQARAFQMSMEATTPEEAKKAGNAIFLAGDCAYKLLPHSTQEDMKFVESMSIEIKALTANTKERFSAYWHGEELASGMVFYSNANPDCE